MLQLIDDPIFPRHPRWDEFMDRLAGPEGCDFQVDHWRCDGDLRATTRILQAMGLSERAIQVSIAYFKDHGGYCDCEVVLNVEGPMAE